MKPSGSEFRRYYRIWRRGVALHFSTLVVSRADFFFYFFGKMLRTLFFLVFLVSLFKVTNKVVGYSVGEVLLFFATMNLIDIVIQIVWYRGFYLLPNMVRSGEFDFFLTRPVSPLFMVAFHIFDLIDLMTLPVGLALVGYAISLLPPLSAAAWGGYLLFLANGFALAFAINIILASLTFYSVQSSNIWGFWRDLIYILRFPPEVFPYGVRIALTYVLPMLVIVAFPVKAALGRLSTPVAVYGLALSAAALVLAWKFWHRSLRAYSSASS